MTKVAPCQSSNPLSERFTPKNDRDRLPLCKWNMKIVDVEVRNIDRMALAKDGFEQTNVVRSSIPNPRNLKLSKKKWLLTCADQALGITPS